MLIVGEKINTSRKAIAAAVEGRDTETIVSVARAQREAGADYLDVNAGTLSGDEPAHLCWLVETVQAALDVPLCLDSPDPGALAAALPRHRGTPILNSISLETDRWREMLPIVTGGACRVVALCMAEGGMPTTAEDRVTVAGELIARLEEAGVAGDHIYVDPLVQPISLDGAYGPSVLEAMRLIRERYPDVHVICGLSNISFGLPHRRLLNRSFLALARTSGLDAALCDPTDRRLMSTLRAVELLLGNDDYCERYLDAHAAGALVT